MRPNRSDLDGYPPWSSTDATEWSQTVRMARARAALRFPRDRSVAIVDGAAFLVDNRTGDRTEL